MEVSPDFKLNDPELDEEPVLVVLVDSEDDVDEESEDVEEESEDVDALHFLVARRSRLGVFLPFRGSSSSLESLESELGIDLLSTSLSNLRPFGISFLLRPKVTAVGALIGSCLNTVLPLLALCYRACSFTLLLLNSFISLSPTLTSFVLYPFLPICLFPFLICFPLTHLCLLCFPLTHSLYLSFNSHVTQGQYSNYGGLLVIHRRRYILRRLGISRDRVDILCQPIPPESPLILPYLLVRLDLVNEN